MTDAETLVNALCHLDYWFTYMNYHCITTFAKLSINRNVVLCLFELQLTDSKATSKQSYSIHITLVIQLYIVICLYRIFMCILYIAVLYLIFQIFFKYSIHTVGSKSLHLMFIILSTVQTCQYIKHIRP